MLRVAGQKGGNKETKKGWAKRQDENVDLSVALIVIALITSDRSTFSYTC